jgi:hypothetical protein
MAINQGRRASRQTAEVEKGANVIGRKSFARVFKSMLVSAAFLGPCLFRRADAVQSLPNKIR